MVIDVDDLGLEVVFLTIAGVLMASCVVAVFVAMVCARRGRQPLGCASLLLAWVLTVSLAVIGLVVWRTVGGEATFYDALSGFGLGGLGWLIARRLWRRQAVPTRPPSVAIGFVTVVFAWASLFWVYFVITVVWDTTDGEARLSDWLWATGVGGLGWFLARGLWPRQPPAPEPPS